MQEQPKIGARFVYASNEGTTDTTPGKIYTIERYSPFGNAQFRDDVGEWNSGAAPGGTGTPVFLKDEGSFLKDIHGQSVRKGDYVAYAFAGPRYNHQAVFEVQSITGPVALCRSTTDSTVITLGVFEDRAIKLKDFAK
jgi:hypothetical protein